MEFFSVKNNDEVIFAQYHNFLHSNQFFFGLSLEKLHIFKECAKFDEAISLGLAIRLLIAMGEFV